MDRVRIASKYISTAAGKWVEPSVGYTPSITDSLPPSLAAGWPRPSHSVAHYRNDAHCAVKRFALCEQGLTASSTVADLELGPSTDGDTDWGPPLSCAQSKALLVSSETHQLIIFLATFSLLFVMHFAAASRRIRHGAAKELAAAARHRRLSTSPLTVTSMVLSGCYVARTHVGAAWSAAARATVMTGLVFGLLRYEDAAGLTFGLAHTATFIAAQRSSMSSALKEHLLAKHCQRQAGQQGGRCTVASWATTVVGHSIGFGLGMIRPILRGEFEVADVGMLTLPFGVATVWCALALFTEWKECCGHTIRAYQLSVTSLTTSGTELGVLPLGELEESAASTKDEDGATARMDHGELHS